MANTNIIQILGLEGAVLQLCPACSTAVEKKINAKSTAKLKYLSTVLKECVYCYNFPITGFLVTDFKANTHTYLKKFNNTREEGSEGHLCLFTQTELCHYVQPTSILPREE